MNNRNWNILCWNIRGINATSKWDAVRDKIEESSCSVICLQETKREHFDMMYIRKFAPKRFDNFDYIPFVGASGGVLVIWSSSSLQGTVIDKQQFGITIRFQSQHNNELWKLTNVYGPCVEPDRTNFINWFRNHQMRKIGSFSEISIFYRSVENRNRAGGNINDTLIFNDAIGQLGLVELPLKDRSYTWSNMQINPLLEQLDWFFTSINLTIDYPNTEALPLAKITSDHLPCQITIGTKIPKANVFRFENY